MHGDDGDQGTSVLHKTELVGLILTGGVASIEIPELFGPRKAGHVAITAWATQAANSIIKHRNAAFLIGQRRVHATVR
jgi:hypothetical protein